MVPSHGQMQMLHGRVTSPLVKQMHLTTRKSYSRQPQYSSNSTSPRHFYTGLCAFTSWCALGREKGSLRTPKVTWIMTSHAFDIRLSVVPIVMSWPRLLRDLSRAKCFDRGAALVGCQLNEHWINHVPILPTHSTSRHGTLGGFKLGHTTSYSDWGLKILWHLYEGFSV